MAEFKKPTSTAEYQQNFAQEYPLMNATEAYYESSRCLFCYDAPCINACPTSIDIPLFIKQINTGNVMGAAKTIYSANHLGNACGKVCPTEVLCEGACVYNHQNVKPIDIGRLQNFATQQAISENKKLFVTAPENGKKVAIIGAGPAGLSCACELRMLGYTVDIYEAKAQPSGLTLYGVAPYKITNEEALDEVAYLQNQFQFSIYYNQTIQNKADLDKLEQNYDAIFIGVGLGKTRSLGIGGENLINCFGAVEFIEKLRIEQHKVTIGDRVVVLGGGNTAMDAASESARLGAKNVILAYRRSKAEKGAYAFEYELAKKVGVKGLFNVSPVAIIGNEKGEVVGVKLIRTAVVDGRLQTIEGSEFVEACDMVIKATGQSKRTNWLSQIAALQVDKKGKIMVNEAYQTGNNKYFAAGDAVNGGAEIVNAVADAKVAAVGIHHFLSN
ncbi:MAG: FAD-dependent oxidoreductase [Chitinophagales bacterium]